MNRKLLPTLVASLCAAAPAFAQSNDDPMRIEGSATAGAIYNRQNGDDKAKIQEYQDLGNGALSNVWARGRNSTNWFEGYGENFGRSDQYMFLRGGVYDMFKAGAYFNEMPHDFSTNAITPFTGVGSGLLITTFPQLNPANWGSFNLGYERKDAGGYFEWQKNSPWYFRVDGNQVKFDGTMVGSAALGTSPGNGYIALPIPVQTSTSNVGVEGGWQSNKATVSLRWDYSKFDQAIDALNWTSPFNWNLGSTVSSNLLDKTSLPPDNTFNKITASGNYRDLPWGSVISARYTYSKTTSNSDLATSQLNSATIPANNLTFPDQSSFHGENINQSFALGWTARPTTTVDTRVYYYWTKLQNKSDQITYGNYPNAAQTLPSGLGCGQSPPTPLTANVTWPPGNCENELYNYTKNDLGFDVWWRLARGQRLGFGYEYWNLDQTRVDYDKAHANKIFLEYKNTAFDTFTGRLKYTYLKRDATSNYSNDGVSKNDPNYLLPYTSAFDMQDLSSNALKLNLDWTPTPLLVLSFQGDWAKNNYKNVTYGRTENDTQGYYLSANWGDPNKFMLNGFGDWQQTKYPSNHRYINTVSGGPPTTAAIPIATPPGWCPISGASANPNCYDPNQNAYFPTVPGGTSYTGSYNWSSQTKDQTWMIGAGADWAVSEKLMLKASYIYVENDGSASFSSPCCAPAGLSYGNPLNIGNFDDTKQQYFNIKAIYALNKNWSFTGGYAYEKFSRNDITSSGFTYNTVSPSVQAPTASVSYANGYYLNPNANQNIVWMTATYRFDAPPLPAPKVAEAPPPVVRPAPPPPPASSPPPPPPSPPSPQLQRITLDSNVLFDFDKAILKPEGKTSIDNLVIGKLAGVQKLEVVLVTGHTDRLGSDAYNLKLSKERADAVRDYLVSKGVDKTKIETIGMGEKQPVVQCDQKEMKALISCLQPNRRVDVQVKGETAK